MRTGRDIEALRQQLADAKMECERLRVCASDELFQQAYVVVKSLELQLDEKLRQSSH
jgi:hypothetical protein